MNLKIIKLNKTHKLFHSGCTHGIRCHYSYSPTSIKVTNRLRELYGYDSNIWMTYSSQNRYPYWIGVKDESYLTMLVLSL